MSEKDGTFELVASRDDAETELRLTAIAQQRGVNLVGSKAVLPVSDPVDVGEIQLQAGSQCEPGWIPTFGSPAGVGGQVRAITAFDDRSGSGVRLYAGGDFLDAGLAEARHIARWDGSDWSPVGAGLDGPVFALATFDDGLGDGPKLYAAGQFTAAGGQPTSYVACWNGHSWSALGAGMNGFVACLTVFDDGLGAGPRLYAGGYFTMAGGVSANRIACWDGVSWSPVGTGTNDWIAALTVFDDGTTGPTLVAGGGFTMAGLDFASRVARWDGKAWAPLGDGVDGNVAALAALKGESGADSKLYVGGGFLNAGGIPAKYLASWSGSSWSAVGAGLNGFVYSIAVVDARGETEPEVFVGGSFDFTVPGGASAKNIARWKNGAWSTVGPGVDSWVHSMIVADDGSGGGERLFVGGNFSAAGNTWAGRIAAWDGTVWSALGTGLNADVRALIVYDDGSGGGPTIYAAGNFSRAGGTSVSRVARWDGASWSPLGPGVNGTVYAVAVFDDGTGAGDCLFVGGAFTGSGATPAATIARWDGSTWSPVRYGLSGPVVALATFDDGSGPGLYAGGYFNGLARWDGIGWSTEGLDMDGSVYSLLPFDDGSGAGERLYAGGSFTSAGGIAAANLACWDGRSWAPVGAGLNNYVASLAMFEDASGVPKLIVGGNFTEAGGILASRVASWDGAVWSALGTGMNAPVTALVAADNPGGGGPTLYAGGSFTTAGAIAASFLARWNGVFWSALPGALNGGVYALLAKHDESSGGTSLYVGGNFSSSPGGDHYLAQWLVCPQMFGDFDGDGQVNGVELAILLGAWGSDVPIADLDQDGLVGGADLALLLGSWTG